jgi:alpha-amylase
MLKDGIPIIYQGQEQHYAGGETPHNREALWTSGYSTNSELYQWIAKLNQIRSHAISQDGEGYLTSHSQPIYSDSHSIAMRKGSFGSQVVGVFTNVGSSSSATVTLSSSATGFGPNQALVDVISCSAYTTDSSGSLAVTLANGLPVVLYPTSRLSGSDICPGLTGGGASPTSGSATTTTTTSKSTSTGK